MTDIWSFLFLSLFLLSWPQRKYIYFFLKKKHFCKPLSCLQVIHLHNILLRGFFNPRAPAPSSFCKKKKKNSYWVLILLLNTLKILTRLTLDKLLALINELSRLKKILKQVEKSSVGQPVGSGCQVHSERRSVQWRIRQPFKTTVDRWVSKTPVRWKETLCGCFRRVENGSQSVH